MGYRSYPKEKIFEVLNWQKENNKNQLQTAEHFNLNRKTVSAWTKDYSYDELVSEFDIKMKAGTKQYTIEKKIPEGLKDQANDNLMRLSYITTGSLQMLSEWVDCKIKQVSKQGAESLKAYELDRMLRIVRDSSPYVMPAATDIEEDSVTLLQRVRNKLAESRESLERKRNLQIDGTLKDDKDELEG